MKIRIITLFVLAAMLTGMVYFAVSVSTERPYSPPVSEGTSSANTSSPNSGVPSTVPNTPATSLPPATGTEQNPSTIPSTLPVTPPKTETPDTEVTYKTVSFFAMGDNMVHDNVMRDASIKAGGTADDYSKGFDFSHMYQYIAPYVRSADLAFVNQETLIAADETKKPKGYPDFNSPRAMGDQLCDLGFDIINLAHNHMLDMKTQGLINSLNYWKTKNGITTVGGYESKDAFDKITVIEKNGIKIALLSYTTFVNFEYTNSDTGVYIPYAEKDVILAQVARAKEIADCVIVSMHWGTENDYNENASQKNLAQALVDAGVDAIIGHHPHMLQTVKIKDRPDGGQTLICYSLGNSVSTMLYIKYMVGACVSFDITKDGDKPVELKNIKVIPTFNYYDKDYRNIKLYLLKDVTQDILDTHGSGINYGGNPQVANLEKRVTDHVPEELIGY